MSHIEQLQGETLLWLACRHHMAELHLKHPYHLIMHVATGPDDPLFKSFKEWFLEQRANALQNQAIFPDPGMFRKWDWGEADAGSPTGPYLKEENWWARQTLEWVTRELLQNTFPRGDYRELCELINFVLGGEAVRIQAGEVFSWISPTTARSIPSCTLHGEELIHLEALCAQPGLQQDHCQANPGPWAPCALHHHPVWSLLLDCVTKQCCSATWPSAVVWSTDVSSGWCWSS